MNSEFKKSLKNILGYCKAKNKREIHFEDPPYEKFIQSAFSHYRAIWSYDLFDHIFHNSLPNLIANIANDAYLEKFIQDVEIIFQQNMQDVFIIIPLKGAYIDSTVTIGNLSIIRTIPTMRGTPPKSLPKEDIIKEISSVTGLDKNKIRIAVHKIIQHRAEDFLSCPLLILKRHGQYTNISTMDYLNYIVRHYNVFLRILANYNNSHENRGSTIWTKANHFFCISEKNNYNHFPLWNSVELNFDFSFLNNASNQKLLMQFVDLFENKAFNPLQSIYFKSLKFFNFSTKGDRFSTNDISYQILNALIGAETLLVFSTRGEKKKKLAYAMAGLAEIGPADYKMYFDAVIEVYSDRSSLVHSGKQEVDKYIADSMVTAKQSQSLKFVNEMMLLILMKFPSWYYEIEAVATPAKFLEKWQEKIRSFIPVEKYNWLQKIIIWIIFQLKKIARIHSEV